MSNPEPDPLDLIWEADGVARELKVNRRRAYHLLSTGEIPAMKVGGRWVVERSELSAFFRSGPRDREPRA